MKISSGLALMALLPLGCGGATPAASGPGDLAPSQRPSDVTVVDLSPASPPEPKEPKPSEETTAAKLLEESAGYGVIGVLNPGDPSLPTGLEDQASPDAPSPPGALGSSFGSSSFGASGLGLSAMGGSGGLGLGTIGHGGGTGTGTGFNLGNPGGAQQSSAPQVKIEALTATAGLPSDVIQRIVRQNYGRFRYCYVIGLRTNPKLAGKVVVRFTIDKTGASSSVSLVKDTTLHDPSVSACVAGAFANLSFPQPDAGASVNVVCPIQFSPAEAAAAPPAKPAPAPVTPKRP
jgi:hypothetical protein